MIVTYVAIVVGIFSERVFVVMHSCKDEQTQFVSLAFTSQMQYKLKSVERELKM
jgi:hypothetical protein